MTGYGKRNQLYFLLRAMVTALTMAHNITLAAATLEVIDVPSRRPRQRSH